MRIIDIYKGLCVVVMSEMLGISVLASFYFLENVTTKLNILSVFWVIIWAFSFFFLMIALKWLDNLLWKSSYSFIHA